MTGEGDRSTITLCPQDGATWSLSSNVMKRVEGAHSRWEIGGWYVPEGVQELLSRCDGGTLLVAGEFCIYCGSDEYADFSFSAVCVKDKEGNVVLPKSRELLSLCNCCGHYGASGLFYGVNSLHRAINICSQRGTAQIQDEIDKYSVEVTRAQGHNLEYAQKWLQRAREEMVKARKRPACEHHWVPAVTPCVDSDDGWFSNSASRSTRDSSKPCNSSIFFPSEQAFYDAVFPLLFLPQTRRGYWSSGGQYDATTHGKAFERAMKDDGTCWAELKAKQSELVKKAVHPTYDPEPVKEILRNHGYLKELPIEKQ